MQVLNFRQRYIKNLKNLKNLKNIFCYKWDFLRKSGCHKIKKEQNYLLFCDSVAIRTQDLLLRRQLLYPAELRNLVVGMTRFELATSSSRTKHATKLRYIPSHPLCKITTFFSNFFILFTKNLSIFTILL